MIHLWTIPKLKVINLSSRWRWRYLQNWQYIVNWWSSSCKISMETFSFLRLTVFIRHNDWDRDWQRYILDPKIYLTINIWFLFICLLHVDWRLFSLFLTKIMQWSFFLVLVTKEEKVFVVQDKTWYRTAVHFQLMLRISLHWIPSVESAGHLVAIQKRGKKGSLD